MAITITDSGNFITFDDGTTTKSLNKPFEYEIKAIDGTIRFYNDINSVQYSYSDITTPSSVDIVDLASIVMAYNNTIQNDVALQNLLNDNNGTFDAFYRQRFSQPETIFDSKQLSDKQPQFWDDQLISGSGGASTYNTNQASTSLSVSNATAGHRVRQTYRRFNYQPGKSQMFILTGILGSSLTACTKRCGLFDEKNGIFFQVDDEGFKLGLRTFTSGVASDDFVNQDAFNIDKMDGTGASGITLDTTKTNIYFADFEWLGVGRVRYGVFINGRPYYIHERLHANVESVVYMSTPNLPIRWEIINDGLGTADSITHICSTIISEGGVKDTGFPYGATRGASPLVTNNDANIYPLMAMRLKSGYLSALIKILDLSITCTSTASFNYYIILNPTITGTALSFSSPANIANSSIEVDVSRTNTTTISGGTLLYTNSDNQANTTSGKNSILNSDFAFGSSIAGVSDIVVIGVQRTTGTTETFYGSINWKDQQ